MRAVRPSRSTMSAASLIATPILFAVAASVVVLSSRTLIRFAADADLLDLAASIEESGHRPDAAYLARFVRANDLDRETTDCGDAFTRANVTVHLASLDAAGERKDRAATDRARDAALRAIEHRLVCNPLDGNAWLRYAIVKARGDGPIGPAIDDLKLSYWTAPSEAWILEPRLAFATPLYVAGVTGFETEYLEDLRRFISFEPAGRVAEAFVANAEPVRDRMRPFVDALPDARRKAVVEAIDGLGVDYWEP